jgi:L-ascorbate metabolism protein UlaG (beta-lactamase superfamily)
VADPAPVVDPEACAAGQTRVTYVGQGTVLIEMDGMRILTDPVLKRWVGPLRRYGDLPDASVRRHIDVILISHLHLDHLDTSSLKLLPKSAVVIGPPHMGRTVSQIGFKTVVETRRDTSLHFGGVEVMAVHARHTRRRWVVSPPTEPLGFIVHGSSTVYFAGDTGLFDGMDDLHERIDVALLPIETWGVRPPEGRHLSPRTAADALSLLRPRIAVPIHWGTLYVPGSAYAGKQATYAWFRRTLRRPEEFTRLAAEGAPDVDVRLLMPGEALSFSAAQRDAPPPGPGDTADPSSGLRAVASRSGAVSSDQGDRRSGALDRRSDPADQTPGTGDSPSEPPR